MATNALSSPYVTPTQTVGAIMRTVIYALIPGMVAYIWFFGWGVLHNIVIACVSALVCEAAMLVIRGRPVWMYLQDGSALVTAMLLALALPGLTPWWVPVIGTFFAIVVAKHLYGGIGFNPFNPAMIGYVVLLVSFPREMSLWPATVVLSNHVLDFADATRAVYTGHFSGTLTVDVVSGATPFDYVKSELAAGKTMNAIRSTPIFGHFGGAGMEWVNMAYVLGGLWLLYRRIITWHIPVAMLAALFCVSAIFYFVEPGRYLDPALHLVGGASMLGAFFIATDPVTAATTPLGRIIYGAGIGFITFAIRAWGGYPDGVAFAVLLMGMAAPLIDRYTPPRVFGERQRRAPSE